MANKEKEMERTENKLRKHPGYTFNESLRHSIIGSPQELFKGGCFQIIITLIVLGILLFIVL